MPQISHPLGDLIAERSFVLLEFESNESVSGDTYLPACIPAQLFDNIMSLTSAHSKHKSIIHAISHCFLAGTRAGALSVILGV